MSALATALAPFFPPSRYKGDLLSKKGVDDEDVDEFLLEVMMELPFWRGK